MAMAASSSAGDEGGLLLNSYKDDSAKRRKLMSKTEETVEAQVAKSIRDNFKQFGAAEIDGASINNYTLRERSRTEKLKRTSPAPDARGPYRQK